MEHPVVRVCPLNPHAGFVAGDDPRRAKNHPRLVGLNFEGVARTDGRMWVGASSRWYYSDS